MPTIHYISHAFLKNRGIGTPQNLLPPHVFSFSSLFASEDEGEEGNENDDLQKDEHDDIDSAGSYANQLISTSTPASDQQVEVVRKKKVVSDLEFADGASKQTTTSAHSIVSSDKRIMSSVPDPSDDSTAPLAATIVRKPKRFKKSEDPVLKALKKKHDALLAKLQERENYSAIEIIESKLKHNHIRGLKAGGKSWIGKIAIKEVDGTSLMLTEAALVNDFCYQLDFILSWKKTKDERIADCEMMLRTPPDIYNCSDTTISLPFVAFATSSRTGDQPFNFMNPSSTSAAWKKEVRKRKLTNVGDEFTDERKKAIVVECVRCILARLRA